MKQLNEQQPLPPSIYLQNVCLTYQEKPLFQDLNLEIPAGQCVCLLGPSGVGKTTILRLLANLIIEKNTTVFSAKITTSDQRPLHNRIAYMAQQDLLMPWLTVLNNVLIGDRLRGKKSIKDQEKQAINLLKTLGLTDFVYKTPEVLSGGMRQRVALARTLLEEHPIILMDEPFSALDAISRLRMQNLAAQTLQGRTRLLVTHDPLEALRLGDIIYVLSGSPAQLRPAIRPSGTAPRDPADTTLLSLQSHLLSELTLADQAFHA